MTNVFIDGSHGTTGLKLFSRLEKRDDINILKIDPEKRHDISIRRELINSSDITFLCLPDDAARESVSLVENDSTVVIDTSTAHRTLDDWAYGFAELSENHRKRIETSKRIAVPGCHASGFISIAYPLVASGEVPADYPFVINSLTGYSGGGKKMINDYENNKTEQLFAPRQYGLTQNHKHLKEMQKICNLDFAPIFQPIVDDYFSGMATSVPIVSRLANNITVDDVYNILAEKYNNSKLISVKKIDNVNCPVSMISANELTSHDSMKIYIGGNDDRIIITSVFDNLGKGASGAAVQCMNISLSLDETTSLVI